VQIPDAERRQLTVMFCDLVGSTPLAERFDPEDLREMVRAYQGVCADVIQRFDGHLARYFGDGLLVYFGYPRAHEDDAQRAVRTGLGIVDEMRRLNARLERERGVRLSARLGIHTGLVVAGEMGGGDVRDPMAIIGETPNIAARLQGVAEPDTVVISAATQHLVRGFFECRDLGPHTLKGVSIPILVHRVLGESAARSRLDVAGPVGLTPLVGREQEVSLLLERWQHVKDSMGQIVLLSGEGGIGKSRLLEVLRERLADEPHTWLECRCSAYHQSSALFSVIELLERVLQFHRDDSAEEKVAKLEQTLAPYTTAVPEIVPLFAALLSVPLSSGYAALSLSPQAQKQKTLQAVLTVLMTLASQQPLVLLVEDLHWVDPSTLELLSLLVDQGPTARILTVLTFRPEFRVPWSMRSHLSQITLTRLPRKQAELMLARVAGGKALPPEVLQQLLTKTDGVPLFVEELAKMVLESGLLRERDGVYELAGPLPPLAIPTTLHDSLMARLDRLATVREVVQLGATLGREFTYEVLHAVSPLDEAALQRELARLVDAELLYQRGAPPDATYIFKHALIQDAAYQSLLKSKRQQYHQQIAQVLSSGFPHIAETQPEILAYHYTAAGLSQDAILYWQVAGTRAIQRSANVEAITYIRNGLDLVATLPDTPERAGQELMLQTSLGLPLMATQGYAAPNAEHAFRRARELCDQLGNTAQVFPVLRGLWEFYVVRGMIVTGRELAEQLWELAQSVNDPASLLEAHFALGETLFFQGELEAARAHLVEGIAIYDPEQHHAHAFFYGEDTGVMCRNYAAWASWYLGYPEQALRYSREAVAMAIQQAHPFTLAIAHNFAAALHHLRGDIDAELERAESAIAVSSEQGFPLWLALPKIFRGSVTLQRGQQQAGIAEVRQGLADWRATGAELGMPFYLGLLAGAAHELGRVDEGLAALNEALVIAHDKGEEYHIADVHRIKGELLLLQQAPRTEVEACFRTAIDIARRQNGKALELRATASLSRLLREQDRGDEARHLLAEIYAWFTEGFDTPDLQRAKQLLAEL